MRCEPPRAPLGDTVKAPAPVATVYRRCRRAAWGCPLDARELKAALEAMAAAARAAGRPVDAVELYLCDDAAMACANARHLGYAGPTNVLSFPGIAGPEGPGAGGPGMAGTLLLSLDTLDRECLFYGQEARDHLLRLLAHGMGHLAGLDHGPEMEALCAACQDAAEAGLAL